MFSGSEIPYFLKEFQLKTFKSPTLLSSLWSLKNIIDK